MNTDLVLEIVAGLCLVLGSLMSLAAAIGLLRFPDLLSRMHAGTKPQVFGLLLLLDGVIVMGCVLSSAIGRGSDSSIGAVRRRPTGERSCSTWASATWRC